MNKYGFWALIFSSASMFLLAACVGASVHTYTPTPLSAAALRATATQQAWNEMHVAVERTLQATITHQARMNVPPLPPATATQQAYVATVNAAASAYYDLPTSQSGIDAATKTLLVMVWMSGFLVGGALGMAIVYRPDQEKRPKSPTNRPISTANEDARQQHQVESRTLERPEPAEQVKQ